MKRLVLAFALTFGLLGAAFAQSTLYWYNFKSQQMEARTDTPSAEKMREYIPQIPPAQGLYDVYIKMGKSHVEAAVLVLEAVVGERKPAK